MIFLQFLHNFAQNAHVRVGGGLSVVHGCVEIAENRKNILDFRVFRGIGTCFIVLFKCGSRTDAGAGGGNYLFYYFYRKTFFPYVGERRYEDA